MTKSIIACPKCEFKAEEEMPTDACQFFYECKSCKSLLKPLVGGPTDHYKKNISPCHSHY